MEVIVLDSKAFEELKSQIKGFVRQALMEIMAEKKASEHSDWLSIDDAKKLLHFKSKTSWQKLRDNGTIQFTQFGRKIMYSRKSITAYINKNIIKF